MTVFKSTFNTLGLIANDGWTAFEEGKTVTDCPYLDDPESARAWIKGHDNAKQYHEWKEYVFKQWSQPTN